MRRFIRQVYRGLGYLPHVGEHPGVAFFLMLVAMGVAIGSSAGWPFIGGATMAGIFAPIILTSAYLRAELNDRLEREKPCTD